MPYSANGDSRLQRKAPFPHDGFGKKSYRVFAVFQKFLIRQTRRLCLQGEFERSPVWFSRLRFPLPDRELASQQPRGTFATACQFNMPPLTRSVMDSVHNIQHMISQIAACPVGAPIMQGQRHISHAEATPVFHKFAGEWHFARFARVRKPQTQRSPQTHWDRECRANPPSL